MTEVLFTKNQFEFMQGFSLASGGYLHIMDDAV